MKIFYVIVIVLLLVISACVQPTEESKPKPQGPADVDVVKETSKKPVEAEEEVEEDVVEEKRENITTVRLCHDTDNGMVRWVEGKIFGFYDNATRFEFNDYCQNFNYLMEFYCEDENPKQQIFLCKNGCEDNHCQ